MQRTFHVFDTPHPSDPIWVAPVQETVGADPGYVQYGSADQLMQCAWKLQFDLGRQTGLTIAEIACRKYLADKGWPEQQIRELLAVFRKVSCHQPAQEPKS